MKMKAEVRKYLSEIGRKGGKKSRRGITDAQQSRMQAGRRIKRLLETKDINTPMVGRETVRRAMEKKQQRERDDGRSKEEI